MDRECPPPTTTTTSSTIRANAVAAPAHLHPPSLVTGAHRGGAFLAAFVDETTAVSVGNDGCVRVWSAPNLLE